MIGVFFGFSQSSNKSEEKNEDPMDSLEDTLKPFISDKIHKALCNLLKILKFANKCTKTSWLFGYFSSKPKTESKKVLLKKKTQSFFNKFVVSILKMARQIMTAIDLPTVEVEIEDILQKVLKPNAFYQASALVRIGKFLALFFMFMLNFMLICTTYWIFQFRSIIVTFISMQQVRNEQDFPGGANEGMEDSRGI